ncbi:uncharacterized protein [Narcine bancroftii]|uniref:uncharacterized protein n=1 Tax=Narcine bancroftii TaxID=1343680 RepID=UPI0038313F3E
MGGLFSGSQACEPYTDAVAFQIIHDAITTNRVVIFSKTTCPYCDIVKCIFTELGVPYRAIELDLRSDGVHLQYILTEMTGIKTVDRRLNRGLKIMRGIYRMDSQHLFPRARSASTTRRREYKVKGGSKSVCKWNMHWWWGRNCFTPF